MAPEQARGEAGVDQRADVFALGAMLAGIARRRRAARRGRAEGAVRRIRRRGISRSRRWPPTSTATSPASPSRRTASAFVDRVTRVVRRYRLPILLVLTYLVVRVLLLWLFRV